MIVLVGKSCSGKDSVAKILCSMGYSRVVTCTTRPMRMGEVDGIDYYFITQSEFMNMIEKGDFAEYREYETEKGLWLYGSRINDYKYATEKVIILTPEGLVNIRKKYPNLPIIAIYLAVPNKELKRRMMSRANISGEDIKEVKRRYKADKKDFRHIKKYVDYVVNNELRDAYDTARICKELDEIEKRKHRKNILWES